MKPDIKILVDKFWKGETTHNEEKELKYILEDYQFEQEYPELYAYFGLIENETAKKLSVDFKEKLKKIPEEHKPELKLEKSNPSQKKQFKYLLAASVVLTISIFTLQNQDQKKQEKEAQLAFEQVKYSLNILSNKMKKSEPYVRKIELFDLTTKKINKQLKK